jgi:hypothetical protein
MTITTLRQAPYLRVQRNFPTDNAQALSIEVDRAYVDTAQKVNARTIGIFTEISPSITGEQWFFSGSSTKQQTLRQIYTFTAAGNIPHGIDLTKISGFVRIFGTFTDGTNWYPLPYVDVVSATNQISLKVTPSNIVITAGAGSPPAITSGIVDIEWLSLI